MFQRKYLGALYVLVLIFVLQGCNNEKTEEEISISQVCHEDKCFDVEIADSSSEQEKGLMFRESMDQDKGMLFIFESEELRSFWMKNTKIALDIIFLDKDKKVASIIKNAEPCLEDPCQTYDSKSAAMYVLEINGGLSDEIGMKISDRLEFK